MAPHAAADEAVRLYVAGYALPGSLGRWLGV